MSYYFSKTLKGDFAQIESRVRDELKKEGFGILTEINVKEVLKKKLDVDLGKYKILGACNPPFSYKSLQAEPRIGLMLPCNVILRETGDGSIEAAAVDPVKSMTAVDNGELKGIARQVREKLRKVIDVL